MLLENMRCILAHLKSNQSSIRLIDFSFVSSGDIFKIITSLDSTNKTSSVIPTKTVKLTNKEICKDLAHCIDESIKRNEFPNEVTLYLYLKKRIH